MLWLRGLLLILISGFFITNSYPEGIASRQEAVYYYNEGVRYQKEGNFKDAIEAYEKALLMSSQYNKFILHNKGVIYAQQGDLKKAEETFLEVLRLDPYYAPAKLNLGLIYDRQPDKLKAMQYWWKMFNVDSLKPKGFAIAEEQKTEQ